MSCEPEPCYHGLTSSDTVASVAGNSIFQASSGGKALLMQA